MQTKVKYSLLRSHSSRLITTAAYANQRFWQTAYGSSPILGRLLNQRFILELSKISDGTIFYAQNQYIKDNKGQYLVDPEKNPIDYGDYVFRLSLKSSPEQEYITYHDACYAIEHPEEERYQAFIQACEQGNVLVEPNQEGLAKLGFVIEHVIHRPNHGIHHSMRVASYIPFLFGFFEGKPGIPDLDELEKLQHMMLFSVVGREDESSFRETGEGGIGKLTAQRYRSNSAIAYLDYVLARENIYSPEEKEALAPYRDALVVELMGFANAALELKGLLVSCANSAWLKKRILLDTQQLVMMGTLTLEEALSQVHAENPDKHADMLLEKISNSTPPRYIVRSVLPEVFVHYIQTHYEQLAQKKQLTENEFQRIQQTPDPKKQAKVIRTLLPELMCDARRNEVFSFINTDHINSRLFMMNRAHCMDLPRCYRLQQWHNVHVVLLNGTVGEENTLSNWLANHPSTQSRCTQLKTQYQSNGTILVFRDKQNRCFIQHGPDEHPNYSEIKEDPELIKDLVPSSAKVKLSHSRLLFHMADSPDTLNASAQCFGEIQLLVHHCIERTPDTKSWEAFKGHLLQLHNLLYSIQSMRKLTGDRQQFFLRDRHEFEAFISQESIQQLFEEYKTRPQAFAKKLTSTLLPGLFDENQFEDYHLPILFHMYKGLSLDDENPSLSEVRNVARMIDLGRNPKISLEAKDIPTIQSLHYDRATQRISLNFDDTQDTNTFCQLYQERFDDEGLHKHPDTSVDIPLARYLHLRDNRYLKFKIETVPTTHSTEATLIDLNTGQYTVLQLIQEGKALVRLHNIRTTNGKALYEHEFDNLENPSTNRRVTYPARLQNLESNSQILARQQFTHPRTRQHEYRNLELEPSPPPKEYQQPQSRELDDPALKTGSIFRNPGGDKNTRFPKKVAYTLVDPEGRTQLYQGTRGERADYFPFGILCDLAEVHLSGERFIWEGRAMTALRFWLGNDPQSLPQGLSLQELQEKQKKGSHEHNELLIRASKSAIRGFITPKDTLIDRLNLVCQAKRIKDRYHIDVPLIILDPRQPQCPRIYAEHLIRDDLVYTLQSMRTGHFPYDDSKVYDIDPHEHLTHRSRNRTIQDKILQNLLTWCGIQIGFFVKTSATGEQQQQLTVLTNPKEDLPKIDKFLKALAVPGGFFAEEAQLGALKTAEEKDAFFIKQVALGNERIIHHLCQDDLPSPELYHRALNIAVKCHGLAFAKGFATMVQRSAKDHPGYEAPLESIESFMPEKSMPSSTDITAAIERIERCRAELGTTFCDYQIYSQIIDDLQQLLDNKLAVKIMKEVCLPLLSEVSARFLEQDRILNNRLNELRWMIRWCDMANSPPPDLTHSLENAKTCVGKDTSYQFHMASFEQIKKQVAHDLVYLFQKQLQKIPSLPPIPSMHRVPLMLSSTSQLVDYIVQSITANQKKQLEQRLILNETYSLLKDISDSGNEPQELVIASVKEIELNYNAIQQHQTDLATWLQHVLARMHDFIIPKKQEEELKSQIDRAQQLITQGDTTTTELTLPEKMLIYTTVQQWAEEHHLTYEKPSKIMQPRSPRNHAKNPAHLFNNSKPTKADDPTTSQNPPDPLM